MSNITELLEFLQADLDEGARKEMLKRNVSLGMAGKYGSIERRKKGKKTYSDEGQQEIKRDFHSDRARELKKDMVRKRNPSDKASIKDDRDEHMNKAKLARIRSRKYKRVT